ncbi:MAG: hypothetical protein C0390_03425 [Syntrophus sp. (in: bacteria)]|nr:hypothetical protein [Syntrophus sp. (in: bacteria)]
MDAFATPFVQGRLRRENVFIQVETECAHCKRPMWMEIDSDMNCRCQETDCRPIIFVPDVDFSRLEDPNIIDAF